MKTLVWILTLLVVYITSKEDGKMKKLIFTSPSEQVNRKRLARFKRSSEMIKGKTQIFKTHSNVLFNTMQEKKDAREILCKKINLFM